MRCVPLTGSPLSREEAEGLATPLKALADPARLQLLSLVLAHEGQEACVCGPDRTRRPVAGDREPPPQGCCSRRGS